MSADQRRAKRIGRESLPEILHCLTMVFDTGEENPVETFDASTMGLGLSATLSPGDMEENVGILLRPADNSFQLLGEVMYVIPQEGGCRFGVQFSQTIAVHKYLELLDGLE